MFEFAAWYFGSLGAFLGGLVLRVLQCLGADVRQNSYLFWVLPGICLTRVGLSGFGGIWCVAFGFCWLGEVGSLLFWVECFAVFIDSVILVRIGGCVRWFWCLVWWFVLINVGFLDFGRFRIDLFRVGSVFNLGNLGILVFAGLIVLVIWRFGVHCGVWVVIRHDLRAWYFPRTCVSFGIWYCCELCFVLILLV